MRLMTSSADRVRVGAPVGVLGATALTGGIEVEGSWLADGIAPSATNNNSQMEVVVNPTLAPCQILC